MRYGNRETTTAAQVTVSGGDTPQFKNWNMEARCEAGQTGAEPAS